MWKFIINALAVTANALTLYIGYLSATTKLQDGRNKTFLSKLRKGGKIYFILGGILIIVQATQSHFLEKLNTREEQSKIDSAKKDLRELKHNSDSLAVAYKRTVDSQNIAMIKMLAEYNFKYDSGQNKIVKLIIDSSKQTIIQEETPTLFWGHCQDTTKFMRQFIYKKNANTGNDELTISLNSQNSTSRNIKLKSSIVGMYFNDTMIYLPETKTELNIETIPKDFCYTTTVNVKKYIVYPILVFWLRGDYFNNGLSKKFSFNAMYSYTFQNNSQTRLPLTLEMKTMKYITDQESGR